MPAVSPEKSMSVDADSGATAEFEHWKSQGVWQCPQLPKGAAIRKRSLGALLCVRAARACRSTTTS